MKHRESPPSKQSVKEAPKLKLKALQAHKEDPKLELKALQAHKEAP